MYENWTFKPLRDVGNGGTPIKQAEGKFSVDYLPNTYQTEVKNREVGNKVVTQATEDDATNGTFNTDSAFKYYSTLVDTFGRYKSRLVHQYNAQGKNDNDRFVTSTSYRNAPGILYNTNG